MWTHCRRVKQTEPNSDSISKTWPVNDGRQVLDQRPVEEKERKIESYLVTTAKATQLLDVPIRLGSISTVCPTESRFSHSIRHSLSFLTRLSVSVYLCPSLLGIPKDEEISIILSESQGVERLNVEEVVVGILRSKNLSFWLQMSLIFLSFSTSLVVVEVWRKERAMDKRVVWDERRKIDGSECFCVSHFFLSRNIEDPVGDDNLCLCYRRILDVIRTSNLFYFLLLFFFLHMKWPAASCVSLHPSLSSWKRRVMNGIQSFIIDNFPIAL
jgi:hypothetical protein